MKLVKNTSRICHVNFENVLLLAVSRQHRRPQIQHFRKNITEGERGRRCKDSY